MTTWLGDARRRPSRGRRNRDEELLDVGAADLDLGHGGDSLRLGIGRLARHRTLCRTPEEPQRRARGHDRGRRRSTWRWTATAQPVTVFAHGLTNSRNELAAFTPFVAGTKVRFDFRGHGLSSVPETGYRFADFARDLDAVARAYGATRAVGTSLGAGAIMPPRSRASPTGSSGSCSCSRPRSTCRSRTIATSIAPRERLESLPLEQAIDAHPVDRRTGSRSSERARGCASSTCCSGRT